MGVREGSARRRWLALAVAGVLAISLAACGDGGSDGSGAPGTDQTKNGASDPVDDDVSAPTGPPIQVMVYSALTGVPTPFPEAVTGAQAAAEGINRAGGIEGRPIEISSCDIGADPNGPVRCARQAVEDQVVAVVGAVDPTGDSLAILEEAGIPSISPYPRLAELKAPSAYPVTTGGVALVAGSITALADQGYKRINVVYSDIPGVSAIIDVVGKMSAESRGVTLRSTSVPQPSADLAPIVADAARDVDAIAIVTTPTDAAKFVHAARQAGLDLPLSGHAIAFDEETIDMLGDAVDGLFVVTNFKPSSLETDPAVEQFNSEMDAIDGKARKNDVSMGAWVGIQLLARLVPGLDVVDSASLTAALDAVDGVELGLIPPVNFVRPKELVPGLGRIFNTSVMYSKVVDGTLVPLDGSFVDVFSAG